MPRDRAREATTGMTTATTADMSATAGRPAATGVDAATGVHAATGVYAAAPHTSRSACHSAAASTTGADAGTWALPTRRRSGEAALARRYAARIVMAGPTRPIAPTAVPCVAVVPIAATAVPGMTAVPIAAPATMAVMEAATHANRESDARPVAVAVIVVVVIVRAVVIGIARNDRHADARCRTAGHGQVAAAREAGSTRERYAAPAAGTSADIDGPTIRDGADDLILCTRPGTNMERRFRGRRNRVRRSSGKHKSRCGAKQNGFESHGSLLFIGIDPVKEKSHAPREVPHITQMQ